MPYSLPELRHSIRGTLNALKLCVSAFEMPLETSEKLEFLSDIEVAAEKLGALLSDFEAIGPADETAPAVPTPISPLRSQDR